MKTGGRARTQAGQGPEKGGLELDSRRASLRGRSPARGATPGVAPGVPRRALADGVVERRRASRRQGEGAAAVVAPPTSAPDEIERLPALLSPQEHYRREQRRRADRVAGDLASLLAEAKAEYEAMINAPRPAGRGGRPRKKPKVEEDEFEEADEE